jgi:DnaJ-class molecular chaperone
METGNLVLTLVLKKHPIFQSIQDFHLLWEIDVHPIEAMTHFVRNVRLPSGEDLSIHHQKDSPFFSVLNKWRVVPFKGLYNPHGDKGHVFISFRIKDFSIADNKRLPLEQFPYKEPSYNSIPISSLELHDVSIPSSPHDPSPNSFHGQPQVQECRPS